MVAAIVEQGADLPGVNGDARTTARFAGQWTEANRSAATPEMGLRIYELGGPSLPSAPAGHSPVYTPPDRRRSGYAGAVVADLSDRLVARGDRVMLYTDLGNPTSNSVYRRIGFRAVAENLRYGFAVHPRGSA